MVSNLDLSLPAGHSINDCIPKPPFSVQYITVDAFIDGIMAWGQGTLMAKFDVASAYHNVAVYPQDRLLFRMIWCNKFYVDMALQFSLRSAPYIFTAITDVVQKMLTHNHSVDFLRHYLDDFLTLGPQASPVCYNNNVVAAYIWGPHWALWHIKVLCDKESAVAVLSSGTSRDPVLTFLLRYLALLAVCHSFSFTATSVRKSNQIVDALSHFQFQQFRHLAPHAEPAATPLLPARLAALHLT